MGKSHSRKRNGILWQCSVKYLGTKQFIANKRALDRKKDIANLEAIGE